MAGSEADRCRPLEAVIRAKLPVTVVPDREPRLLRPRHPNFNDKSAAVGFAYRLAKALEPLTERDAYEVMFLLTRMMPPYMVADRAGESATSS